MHMDFATFVINYIKDKCDFSYLFTKRDATPHSKLSKSYLIFLFLFLHKKQRPISQTENPIHV